MGSCAFSLRLTITASGFKAGIPLCCGLCGLQSAEAAAGRAISVMGASPAPPSSALFSALGGRPGQQAAADECVYVRGGVCGPVSGLAPQLRSLGHASGLAVFPSLWTALAASSGVLQEAPCHGPSWEGSVSPTADPHMAVPCPCSAVSPAVPGHGSASLRLAGDGRSTVGRAASTSSGTSWLLLWNVHRPPVFPPHFLELHLLPALLPSPSHCRSHLSVSHLIMLQFTEATLR